MALIDVSELITDPDFSNEFTLVTRAATINQYGEMDLTETSNNVTGVIQNINSEVLKRFPDAAQFSDGISVWYRGALQAQSTNGYCDVVVWNGYRYLVQIVHEGFLNFGSGWTSAICSKEVPSA